MFYRYSLGPTAAAGVLAWGTGRPEAFLLALTGGGVALSYWTVQRWWPDRWRLGGLIDGPIAVAELGAGLTVNGGLLAVLSFLAKLMH